MFASKFAPRANEIKLKIEELSVDGIKQFYMDCAGQEAKYDVLVELYSLLVIGQSIIFCRVRGRLPRGGYCDTLLIALSNDPDQRHRRSYRRTNDIRRSFRGLPSWIQRSR